MPAARWTVIVLSLACLTRSVAAQPTPAAALVTGRVVDAATLAALPGVEVMLLGGASLATTDASGDFRATVAIRGSITLVLRKIGYEAVGIPLSVDVGDSLHIATMMTRLAQSLDTLRVRGRAEQLARTASVSIGDVLRGIMGIKVTTDRLGLLDIEPTRGGRLDRRGVPAPCRVRVLVDGHLMPLGMPLPIASPKEVRAMEVYTGPATMPLELVPVGAYAYCGLIVVWTK